MNESDWKANWLSSLEKLSSLPGVTNNISNEMLEEVLEEQWQNELIYRKRANEGMKYLTLEDIENCIVSTLESFPVYSYDYEAYPNGARKYVVSEGGHQLGSVFLNPGGNTRGNRKYSSIRPESNLFFNELEKQISKKAAFLGLAYSNKSISNDTDDPEQLETVNREVYDDEESRLAIIAKKFSNRNGIGGIQTHSVVIWEKIAALKRKGLTHEVIAERMSLTKSNFNYHWQKMRRSGYWPENSSDD